jgi:hypothetical protein
LTVRRILGLGLAYVWAYVLITTLLPRPREASTRALLMVGFVFLPTVVAGIATLRASRRSGGAQAAFWALLAAACGSHAVNQVLYVVGVLVDAPSLMPAAQCAYSAFFVLVTVALLVRPHRPLAAGQVRAAALELTMAAVGGGFLVAYFVLIPTRVASYPWLVVYTAQEALPGVVACGLALRRRDGPFHEVYSILAAGLLAGAVVGIPATWSHVRGTQEAFGPLDVGWVLPFLALVAAAASAPAPVWVAPSVGGGDRRRARIAALAMLLPVCVDSLGRLLGGQPHLAEARTQAAVAATAVLALLAALRVCGALGPRVSTDSPSAVPGAASAFLQLASGAAHELNNPFMAVAGWAQLAARRRAAPVPELQELIASVGTAADAVARLGKLAHGAQREEDA